MPNVAIEVVSPHDYAEDLWEKIAEYFNAGVQLVWVVFPRQQFVYAYESFGQIRILTKSDTLQGGVVLPGFSLPLTEIFREETIPT